MPPSRRTGCSTPCVLDVFLMSAAVDRTDTRPRPPSAERSYECLRPPSSSLLALLLLASAPPLASTLQLRPYPAAGRLPTPARYPPLPSFGPFILEPRCLHPRPFASCFCIALLSTHSHLTLAHICMHVSFRQGLNCRAAQRNAWRPRSPAGLRGTIRGGPGDLTLEPEAVAARASFDWLARSTSSLTGTPFRVL